MTNYLLLLLVFSIGLIVWLTAYKKMNAFFALLIAALMVGLLAGLSPDAIVATLKTGFGHTMEKIGLLIILGTALGVILEKTGATLSMAEYILRRVSDRRAPLAMSITGFVVGIPIFCDSGFIILSGLNHSLTRKTKIPMSVMAIALATSLYSVHCLVPPHPGITAAAATLNADIGSVMIVGIFLAIPAAMFGYWWSIRQGSKFREAQTDEGVVVSASSLPSAFHSFLPVIIPIGLIALKSVTFVFWNDKTLAVSKIISFVGEPVVALSIALIVSVSLVKRSHRSELNAWLASGIEKAGLVLAIIAAGGMFGEILQATGVGANLGIVLSGFSLGIFFPFLLAAILKTAQGSSTVAIITTSTLVAPLLVDLGMDSSAKIILCVLSMGAGSMVISHANDAYFWVISKFSDLEIKVMLRVYAVVTLLMGILVQFLIWIAYNFV